MTAVRVESGGFVTTLGTGERVRSRAVLLALPLPSAVRLFEVAVPGLARSLARIPMVSTAVVFHAFRKANVDHLLDGLGLCRPLP